MRFFVHLNSLLHPRLHVWRCFSTYGQINEYIKEFGKVQLNENIHKNRETTAVSSLKPLKVVEKIDNETTKVLIDSFFKSPRQSTKPPRFGLNKSTLNIASTEPIDKHFNNSTFTKFLCYCRKHRQNKKILAIVDSLLAMNPNDSVVLDRQSLHILFHVCLDIKDVAKVIQIFEWQKMIHLKNENANQLHPKKTLEQPIHPFLSMHSSVETKEILHSESMMPSTIQIDPELCKRIACKCQNLTQLKYLHDQIVLRDDHLQNDSSLRWTLLNNYFRLQGNPRDILALWQTIPTKIKTNNKFERMIHYFKRAGMLKDAKKLLDEKLALHPRKNHRKHVPS
ncbi:hypothetical protein RFI_21297 [Reticulomyxa filosa]|uniref:Uncharacterized protein n=1 Tax=Reticulomyxa filosa TaxID=46433 RepID=X6MQX9_RETFI|nr:hypothetical protein RFI_21297 [Reticulomyxa filosa]|eukprot:ETO16066.1 hypothetical protein RFI_21297 [Reticulomyxa filosa]